METEEQNFFDDYSSDNTESQEQPQQEVQQPQQEAQQIDPNEFNNLKQGYQDLLQQTQQQKQAFAQALGLQQGEQIDPQTKMVNEFVDERIKGYLGQNNQYDPAQFALQVTAQIEGNNAAKELGFDGFYDSNSGHQVQALDVAKQYYDSVLSPMRYSSNVSQQVKSQIENVYQLAQNGNIGQALKLAKDIVPPPNYQNNKISQNVTMGHPPGSSQNQNTIPGYQSEQDWINDFYNGTPDQQQKAQQAMLQGRVPR